MRHAPCVLETSNIKYLFLVDTDWPHLEQTCTWPCSLSHLTVTTATACKQTHSFQPVPYGIKQRQANQHGKAAAPSSPHHLYMCGARAVCIKHSHPPNTLPPPGTFPHLNPKHELHSHSHTKANQDAVPTTHSGMHNCCSILRAKPHSTMNT